MRKNNLQRDLSTSCFYPIFREGDWVCISCNNINFAFRELCNRCKIQTKQLNYYSYNLSPQESYIDRSISPISIKQINSATEVWPIHQNDSKVFESALLLTPTKQNFSSFDCQEPYKSPGQLPSVSPILKNYNRTLQQQQMANDFKAKSVSRAKNTHSSTTINITSFIQTEEYKDQNQEDDAYWEIDKIIKKLGMQ